MKLRDLMEQVEYKCILGTEEVDISSVVYDSRKVEKGSLFVCMKGFQTDGHQYIPSAVEKGAVAILAEDEVEASVVGENVAVLQVKDARAALALLSAKWFDYPAKKMTMIGLTGTKGKTTTAHMIKKIFEEAGNAVGMIGTLGAYIGEEKMETNNTTPESYELHSLFHKMYEKGCKYVVMEVSSQALKLNRTLGITFDYGVFLNLSPDHISPGEHADFEEYKSCKKLLFKQVKKALINMDDTYGPEFLEEANDAVKLSAEKEADYMAKNIENLWEKETLGVTFEVCGKMDGKAIISMPGKFNVQNALTAIAIAHMEDVPSDVIASGLKKVFVKGRTQVIGQAADIATFIIDYAHNAISMESLLSMLKAYNPNRLICLFGGGGNKPKQRRYDMGMMAGKYADLTILTEDNPRFESIDDINDDIIVGLDVHQGKYEIIKDRKEAIHHLMDTARPGDIVALIGKGHETYQDVMGKKYYFCEEEIILDYLKEKCERA